jgi:signal transduction histidine kinase
LIENSIKYIDIEKNQQIVDISVKRDRNNIIIKLADNGLGIPAEHQERIFEMFFRASNNAEGTGLGLFILKRAVERLKGDVSLTSELSKGTTFIISLPLQ